MAEKQNKRAREKRPVSPTDKSAFPSVPVLAPGDSWFERRVSFRPARVTQILKKAPEGKGMFECGEVGYLWYKKIKKCH